MVVAEGGNLLRRPDVANSRLAAVRAWAQWFGFARLVGAAVSMVVVLVGGYWLLRSPPPSSESVLPRAPELAVLEPTEPGMPTVLPVPVAIDPVIVHVAGAVLVPGVYELPAGSRVVAAVEAAGGAEPGAVLDALNLAALVVDGQRVHVPAEGEPIPPVDDGAGGGPGGGGAGGSLAGLSATPIDLNRAGAGELVLLPGIGPATAAAIIDDRDRHGPFTTVDEVLRVRGIGPAKLEAIRELVVVR